MHNADAPRILTLIDEEQEWLTTRLSAAKDAGLLDDEEELIDSFDADREDWQALPLGERGNAGMLVNIYGVALGHLVAQEFDLEWCAIEREDTHQIGLYGATGEIVFLPLQTVSQRWEDATQRSLADLLSQVRESLRAAQEGS